MKIFLVLLGGVIIKLDEQVIGGIGVSGRKGKRDHAEELMQDNELANFGREQLTSIL